MLIYTTVESLEQAQELVETLLDQKLIACANMRPHTSMFPWEGNIAIEEEIGMILKTTVALHDEARKVLFAHHPYKTPCILSSPVEASGSFAEWVNLTCQ